MKKNTTAPAKLGLQKEVISHLGTSNSGVRLAADMAETDTGGTGGQTTMFCLLSNLLGIR